MGFAVGEWSHHEHVALADGFLWGYLKSLHEQDEDSRVLAAKDLISRVLAHLDPSAVPQGQFDDTALKIVKAMSFLYEKPVRFGYLGTKRVG